MAHEIDATLSRMSCHDPGLPAPKISEPQSETRAPCATTTNTNFVFLGKTSSRASFSCRAPSTPAADYEVNAGASDLAMLRVIDFMTARSLRKIARVLRETRERNGC